MKIIIFGTKLISEQVVKNLEIYDDEVTVVGYPDKFYNDFDKKSAEIISGNLLDDEFLSSLTLESYDYSLILEDDDFLNFVLSKMCKKYGAKNIITKVNRYDDINFIIKNKESFGIDYIINEDLEASKYIVKMVEEDIGFKSDIFAGGKVLLSSIKAQYAEDFVNKKLEDIGLLSTVRVVGILRNSELIIPTGQTIIERDDLIYVMGLSSDIISLKNTYFYFEEHRQKKEMTIIGDSDLTRALVENVSEMNIKIVEEDDEKVADLRKKYPEAFVIKNNFKNELKSSQEEFKTADVLIASTEEDELNIAVGLLASGIGIKDIILKVYSRTYNKFIDSLPVDAVINPKIILVGKILNLIGKNAGLNIYHMFGDRAEVLEVKLKDDSHLIGKTMAELNPPKNIVIGAIIRKDNLAIIPIGKSEVAKDDTLVIFFKKENRNELQSFLGISKRRIFPNLFGGRRWS